MIRQDLICEKCKKITKDECFSPSIIKDSRLTDWTCKKCGQVGTTIIYWGLGHAPHVKTVTFIGDLWDKRKTLFPGDAGYNEAVIEDSKAKKVDGGKRKRKG